MTRRWAPFGSAVALLNADHSLVSYSLTSVSLGFTERTLFIGAPFLPIQILVDGYVSNFVISPNLPSGLVLDSQHRLISGVYSGEEMTQTYELTAVNNEDSVSAVFTLSFERTPPLQGLPVDFNSSLHVIDVCYYDIDSSDAVIPNEWYYQNAANHCANMDKLVVGPIVHNFHEPTPFTLSMFGYIFLPESGLFSFYTNCTTGMKFFLNNDPTPVLSVFNTSLPYTEQQSASVPLPAGLHFIRVFYVSTKSPMFALYYRDDTRVSDWQLLDAPLLRQGGVSPQHLTEVEVLGSVHTAIASKPPAMNGAGCVWFFVTSSLPFGLVLDKERGVIEGQPTVRNRDML